MRIWLVIILTALSLQTANGKAVMYGDTYFNGSLTFDGNCRSDYENVVSSAYLNVYFESLYINNSTPLYNCTKRNRCLNTSDFLPILNQYRPKFVLIYIGGDCINQGRSNTIVSKILELSALALENNVTPIVGNLHKNPTLNVTSINSQLAALAQDNKFILVDSYTQSFRHNAFLSNDGGIHINTSYYADVGKVFGRQLKTGRTISGSGRAVTIAPILMLLLDE